MNAAKLLASAVRAARKALASPMKPRVWLLEGDVALEKRGKNLWRAAIDPAHPLRLRNALDGRCLCPAWKEFDTDLASVPKLARLAGKASKALHLDPDSFPKSAVFHDALYGAGWCWAVQDGKARRAPVTRGRADALLFLCLAGEGATVADGLAYYNGVRLGGASRWKASRHSTENWPLLFDDPSKELKSSEVEKLKSTSSTSQPFNPSSPYPPNHLTTQP